METIKKTINTQISSLLTESNDINNTSALKKYQDTINNTTDSVKLSETISQFTKFKNTTLQSQNQPTQCEHLNVSQSINDTNIDEIDLDTLSYNTLNNIYEKIGKKVLTNTKKYANSVRGANDPKVVTFQVENDLNPKTGGALSAGMLSKILLIIVILALIYLIYYLLCASHQSHRSHQSHQSHQSHPNCN
jgi:ATP-dependent Zn protease